MRGKTPAGVGNGPGLRYGKAAFPCFPMRLFPCALLPAVLLWAGAGAVALRARDPRDPAFNRADSGRIPRPLIVGASGANYPYSWTDPDGCVTGFSVELLDAVARTMDLEVKRVCLDNDTLQARFRAGEFDLLQMLSESRGRDTWADFSVPYLTLHSAMFVRRELAGVRRLEELHDRTFAIAGVGSASDLFVQSSLRNIKIVYVGSAELALRAVDEGRADATIFSRLTALAQMDWFKLRHVVLLEGCDPGFEIRHCFAVHEGNAVLLARLNEGLAVLHRTGEYDRIYRKWFARYEPARFTREEVVTYVAAALALALLAAVWGWLWQRRLHRCITGQAREIADQEGLLRALY